MPCRAPRRRADLQDPEVAPLLSEFNDDDLYFLAPGGDFEHGAAAGTLEGDARIAGGSSVFSPFGSGDHSLQLPVGSAATSPAFCVDERYPRFRMSVGQLGAKKAEVQVSVVYPGLRDNVRKTGDVTADEKHRWRLSNKLNLDPQRGLKRKAWRLVALRFEVLKSDAAGDARVDDVLVDPKMRF